MTLCAVLLDMGGVLLDVGNAAGLPVGRTDFRGREVLMQAARRRGGRLGIDDLERALFAPWRADYERRYETGREAAWEPHLVRLRKATGTRARNLTLLQAWFAPYAETVTPVAGARQALLALRERGLKLALVSNVPLPGKLYERLLKKHRLLPLLDSLHWSYESGSRKPSPAMLRAALVALGEPPSAALMVGDRRNSDVAAGRAAGLRTVWVRSADGGGPRPDREIASIAELPALVGSLE